MVKFINKEDWKEISINIFGREIGIYVMDNVDWEEDWEYMDIDPKSMVEWWDHIGKYIANNKVKYV